MSEYKLVFDAGRYNDLGGKDKDTFVLDHENKEKIVEWNHFDAYYYEWYRGEVSWVWIAGAFQHKNVDEIISLYKSEGYAMR